MRALLLLGLAAAAPAAASSWVTIDPATGRCAPTHPQQHRYHGVSDTFARREDVARVEEALRARALNELLEGACAGRSPAQCDTIRAATGVQVVVDLDKRVACGAAIVAADIVADPDGGQRAEAELARAAAGLAQALSGAPLAALDVRWASGCGAGAAGTRLGALLRRALIANGGQVTEGAGDRAAALIAPGDPLTVELWRYPASGDGALVSTARVPAGWLGVHGATGDRCHGEAALGLAGGADGGRKAGASGLRVELDLQHGEALCAGEQAAASLKASAPATLQLWSVGRSGEAWLTWTSAALGAPTDRRVSLDLEAAWVPALGEEQLVILAAPPGAALLPGAPGCRLPALPAPGPAVAMATAPFHITAPGQGRCAALPPEAPPWSAWQSAPPCR